MATYTYEELKQRVRKKGRDGSAAQPAGRYEALKARVRSGDYARELDEGAADPAMRTGIVRPHATPVGPRKSQMAFADDWFGRGYGLLTQAGDGSYQEYEARRDALERLMADYDAAARYVSRNRDAYADGGGAYKALTEVHDALLGQQDYYNAFSDEETYDLARQSAQKQERAAREREAFIGPDSEGAHAFGDAWPRYVELSQKEALTKGEKKEAKAALKAMLTEYPNMENAASLKYPEEMRLLYARLKTKSDWRYGFSAGLVDALGMDWVADKLSAAGAKLSGQEPLKQSSQAWTQEVKASDTWASGAGGVAGNLLLLSGAGKAANAAAGAVPGLSKAAPALQNIVKSGLTFGLTGAYQAAANTHTKGEWDALEKEKQAYYALRGVRYEPVEYSAWRQVGDVLTQAGISAVGGAAGSAAGTVVGDLGKAVLVKHGLQTPFAEALRQTLAGTAFAAGNTASTYFLYPEGNRPSKERMAQDLAVAFLFSALTSTINTWRTTGANKAFLEDAVKKQRQAYESMGRKGMSVTESLAAMDDILANNQKIRAAVSENYYAGQQRFVDEMLRDLAAIDEQINIIKNGLAGGGQATAGATGGADLAPFPPGGAPATQPTPPTGAGLTPGGALSVQPPTAPLGPVEANAYPAVIAKALALAPETEAHQLAAAMAGGVTEPTEERLGALQRALAKVGEPTPLQPGELREGAGNTPTAGMEAARPARAQGQASSAAAPLDTYGAGEPGTMRRAGVLPPTGARTVPRASSAPYAPPAGRAGADVIQGVRPPMHTVATAAKATLDSGAAVEVKGVAAVEDAGLFLRLADGKTAPLEAVAFDDPAMDKLYGLAAKFDTKAAKAFVSGYDGALEPGSYYNGFASIYGGARTGKTLEQAVSGSLYGRMLPSHIQQLAYFAGQNAGKLADARLPAAAQAGRAAESPLRESPLPATMTLEEQGAIRQYKSGSASYILNEKLYSGAALSDADEALADNLDKALDKLPNYEGTTYRVLCFDRQGKEAYEAFIAQHVPNTLAFYGSYISAAKTPDAFDVDGTLKVKIEIEGKTGKDVSKGFGLEAEQEILYGRTVNYITKTIETAQDGTPVIKIKEVSPYDESVLPGRKEPVDSAHQGNNVSVRKMQEMERPGRTRQGGLRSIPERDTAGSDTEQSGSLQGALSGGQRDPGRESVKPYDKLAQVLANHLIKKGTAFNSALLFEQANKAYGGTMAEGAYTVKDAYDALELAVNKTLLATAKGYNGDVLTAVRAEKALQKLLGTLPTQTKRTEEQQSFQQFSTPPNIAYLAAWAANIAPSDVVLEPSAGIGGLAVFPKAWGATVVVNELSRRRLAFLQSMGFDRVFNENAEQIHNVLPEDVAPSVVLMNPPFSATAGRTSTNKTANAIRHIEQALLRLNDGGRLVAILGKGMADDAPAFKPWWDALRQRYTIRANIGIDGENYKKYGTTWGVQLVIIDKAGPQQGETKTGVYKDLTAVPRVLEGIRNDRQRIEKGHIGSVARSVDEPAGMGNPVGGGAKGVSNGGTQRPAGAAAGNQRPGAIQGAAKRGSGLQGGNPVGIPTTTEGSGIGGRTGGQASEVPTAMPGRPELLDAARPESEPALRELTPKGDNGVYAAYVPAKLPIRGARAHPAPLVESAAMAAVRMPKATYKPDLPASLIEGGGLSAAQLENIVYAGQAHQQTLPDGTRKGYFIGDGTGVGKGRQISGIILDNFRQGREKAIWVSKNLSLLTDAQRDWADIGQNKEDIVSQAAFKLGEPISLGRGILFTGYDTLRSGKGAQTRISQLVAWAGKDFDGVIAFDEAHNMGNLLGKKGARGMTKGSAKAQAGVDLQKLLPNARIVYVSATGATDVNELAYAQRLGLWGRGTAFNDVNDFVSKIGSSGIAAMELVARDMKAMGVYLARSISYDGVTYETLQHTLSPMQTEIYNAMSVAWQVTMQNIGAALNVTNANLNPQARSAARSAYYGAMQRFYNQALTSMSMPTVIEDIKKELAEGHSCVLQIVNTNAAEQERQIAKIKEAGGDLEELDLTPRGTLIGYLENSFPIYAYEEYTDEDGKTRSRLVMGGDGKPVVDRQALAMRDKLLAQINEMSIPDGPLEMLFDAFGTDAVAEVTGRGRRIVPKADETGRTARVEERRSKNHTEADIQAFQDGKKRILVFSDAGGTGKSYHADLRAKNQQKRIHYLLQPGWSASTATQGFGRTHRSNQAITPSFKLVTTNIMGQKRFVSTIARRLDQLGALTKGQRETGSGMFTEMDNLESGLARDSLRLFYESLGGNCVEGVDGLAVLGKMGLADKFTDEYGKFKVMDENIARDMNTFLNRILALEVDEQNAVFNAFYRVFEAEHDKALESGTLDRGMENVKADRIEIVDERVIRTDEISGATTNYVQAKTYQRPRILASIPKLEDYRSGFEGLYVTDVGDVRAVYRVADKTSMGGKVSKMYRLQTPVAGKYGTWSHETLSQRAKKLERKEWAKSWKAEVAKAPEYDERTIHMLTGTLLPIWDRMPQEGNTRAMRIIAGDGRQYLGRVIPADQIDAVLRQLGAEGRTRETFNAKDILRRVLAGETARLTKDRQSLVRKRVSGEYRIEVLGKNLWYLPRNYQGIIAENINYENRYFIPTGEKGEAILEALLKDNPVTELSSGGDVDFMQTGGGADAWRAQRIGAGDKKPMPVSDIIGKMRHDFGMPIAKGRMPRRNIQGQYDKHAHSIKTRIANDLPTVAHELGHHLDNLYGVTEGLDKGRRAELADKLSDEMREAYPPGKLKTEGFAEYVRKYLQNRETAKLDYPLFSAYFETALPAKDLALVNAFADEVNAYYSLDAGTAQSSIRLMEEGPRDFRTPGEKAGEAYHKAYQAWVDRFHGIRLFDRAAGSNTYMRAINSAYADAVAYAVLTGDLTDRDGQRVGDGLAKALEGIKLKDKKEYLAFGEYLIVRHGPERLAEGKRVFPDDRKNSTPWMNRRQAELERAYPAFAQAADRIYGFQRSFLQTWGVETNLVPAEAAARWEERWPCYVPFNRALEKGAQAGAKRGFANQDSTIRHARGSGLDLRHPVDNIINNVVKMVTAGLRNQVMLEVANAATAQAGLGAFLEQVREPVQQIVYDASGLKASLNQEVGQVGLAEEDVDKVFGIIQGLDDYLVQFGRGKARGDVIAVLRKGKPEYWKVNDPLLLESLTNMNAKEAGAIAQAYGTVSRFITGNITGLNLVWAVGSNTVRDLGTLLTYSQDKNLVNLFTGIGAAYLNALRKPDRQDPIFKEYRAVGGGSESAYTADKNMVRNVKAKLAGSKKHWLNPLEWIEAASDIIESGPRFATYRILRKRGFTPQEAIYAAHDITVNFRRGGSMSRQLNNFVPFFNAGVQGVDKLLRWASAEDAPKGERAKAARSRVCQYIAAFGLLGFLQWFINSREDEDKKYYAQLSAYTKNNFWCLPIYEDGKHTGEYLTIPKPRELAIPASLVSALLEQNASGNGEAFHEFDDYALGAYLPNLADDAVKALLDVVRGDLGAAGEDLYGALGSLGLFGVFAYSFANRDFLGKPIESASFADMEPKDRFTGRTSKAAYAIGQAFNLSPIIVDYFLQNTLGGFWKAQKALLPVDAQSADPSLGIAGTYVRDSQYSTDIVNALYEGKQAALQAKNSDPADITKAIRYKEADSLATFYSRYNALAKGDAESPESKAVRQVVLDMIAEFNRSAGSGYRSETQAKIDALCAQMGDTSLMCAPMQPFILDDEKARHDLTAAQYVEFQGTYNSLYWQYVGAALNVSHAFATDEIAVRQANARAIREAKTLMLSRLGVGSAYAESLAREKDVGVTAQDDILFQAALEAAGGDGALHKQEVYGLLEGMDWLDDRQREYLFGSQAAYSGASNIYKTTSQLNDWINGQRKEGRDDSSIAKSITSVYKPLYQEYYLSGDQAGLREIEGKLLRLDLRGKDGAAYYTLEMLEEWIVE